MDRKLKNTLVLISILILIIAGGILFTSFYQQSEIDEKENQIKELQVNAYDTEELLYQLEEIKKRSAKLDSVLALRKFNVPVNLPQSRFYDFVNRVSFNFSPNSFVNIEYQNLVEEDFFKYYVFTINGTASFNDLYSLIYAIEQSKELKKISSGSITNLVKVNEEGFPLYLVSFKFTVSVYFSADDRFATSELRENRLKPNPLFDFFYPLIRNEIPPNVDNLLDVQSGKLLALIPDGAFISDSKGNTYLLWEGDEVYLGYLTEIDFESNEVHFILNKGGIIEKVVLSLEKENKMDQ
ncbi:MAG: hypothetical protein K8F60_11110 [Melioribacteraceae bacterium]|nr:hypothetical protein [Melioribacteraceae bacterium]